MRAAGERDRHSSPGLVHGTRWGGVAAGQHANTAMAIAQRRTGVGVRLSSVRFDLGPLSSDDRFRFLMKITKIARLSNLT